MASSRTSFTKRQKEQSRMEKRREKEARKKQRALDKKMQSAGGPTPDATEFMPMLADSSQPSEEQD